MSVVGFDIGNFKSSVGIARAGGIEIVANEYSDRITPTYVSFANNERFQGHSAKQQEITNSQNTISCFKRLLARKFTDPQVQNERSYQALRISQSPDATEKILINVDYMNETRSFTCEQITAMFLTKLKSIAEMNLNTKVIDCVITVPSCMTDAERRALLDSASIAGLNCLKLINETTAVALSYGLYHNGLPEPTEKPHVVVFVDMGYSQLQASAVAFHKGKLRVLATVFDNNLGGRDFDRVLMDYFNKDFKARYPSVDAYSNTRARLRLRAECEKLKKLMSSNSSAIPLNIECFMNDVDVSGRMKRDEFESLSEQLLARVRKTLLELLAAAQLTTADVDLVEIVGGSTRIPAVKQIISDVFAKEPSTTLNADEACARGATLMCAILSPTFKVKEFKIEDCQLFPITLSWKGAETDDNELEVFPRFEKTPLSKLLTIYKRDSFEIEARYRFPNAIPFGDARIGKFLIGSVPTTDATTTTTLEGASEIKLKARITKNGIFEISSPQMIELVQDQAATTTATTATTTSTNGETPAAATGGETAPAAASDATAATPAAADGEEVAMGEEAPAASGSQPASHGEPAAPAAPAKKRKTKAVDLPLTAKVPQMTKTEINNFVEQELQMIANDRKEKERSEAKNSVEEYVYEMREKLSNEYERFSTEENSATFLKMLDETENWLYSEEAENQEKSVYVDRLQKLKSFGEPLRKRYRESQERPFAFEELGKSIQLIRKALDLFYQNDDKYSHLDKSDVERVAKVVEEKQAWLSDKTYLVNKAKLSDDPVVLASQIKDEKDSLDRTAWSVLNKPKPKVEPPKPAPAPEEPAAATPNGAAPNTPDAKSAKPSETMETE